MSSTHRATCVKRPTRQDSSDSDETSMAPTAKKTLPTKTPTDPSSSLRSTRRVTTSVKRPVYHESSSDDESPVAVAPPAKRAPPTKTSTSSSPPMSDWEREMEEAPSFDEDEETRRLEEYANEGNSSHQSGLSVTTAVMEKGASMATPKR
ncbi:hypothetical protein CRE_21957 [Caenorhabditis remanei]|uniref:Uncharacterized protein n=1 Tax=Caenorhabditis remanei TaxID=31234 RepID=E3MUI9_CAERE|nr:hypothetical protein CRE_21957 [Caenorhabditis remanei]